MIKKKVTHTSFVLKRKEKQHKNESNMKIVIGSRYQQSEKIIFCAFSLFQHFFLNAMYTYFSFQDNVCMNLITLRREQRVIRFLCLYFPLKKNKHVFSTCVMNITYLYIWLGFPSVHRITLYSFDTMKAKMLQNKKTKTNYTQLMA